MPDRGGGTAATREPLDKSIYRMYTYAMAEPADWLSACEGFQWDKGNPTKIWEKHAVGPAECEEVFLNTPLLVAADRKHSAIESRYYALGQTEAQRRLFVVFTVRKKLIRVISARNMNRRERKEYERAQAEEAARDSEV